MVFPDSISWLKCSFAGFALLVCCSCSHEEDYSNPYVYTVKATGFLLPGVPAGNASFSLLGSYNESSRSFLYNVNWKNLSSPPVGGGLYAAAPLPAPNAELISWAFHQPQPLSGIWHSYVLLDSSTAAHLLNDSLHFVLRTQAYPNGKFQGRLKAELQYP